MPGGFVHGGFGYTGRVSSVRARSGQAGPRLRPSNGMERAANSVLTENIHQVARPYLLTPQLTQPALAIVFPSTQAMAAWAPPGLRAPPSRRAAEPPSRRDAETPRSVAAPALTQTLPHQTTRTSAYLRSRAQAGSIYSQSVMDVDESKVVDYRARTAVQLCLDRSAPTLMPASCAMRVCNAHAFRDAHK